MFAPEGNFYCLKHKNSITYHYNPTILKIEWLAFPCILQISLNQLKKADFEMKKKKLQNIQVRTTTENNKKIAYKFF